MNALDFGNQVVAHPIMPSPTGRGSPLMRMMQCTNSY
jgi:hypothetical protein